jgi:succinate dehydrogenase / fumarate reductase flavoprotein subunit
VIDRLLRNGIDLTKTPVEVGPMAHYHMGGVRVNTHMETRINGLYAAGEAVGGANGANRLSGNAITEAFVFGERAGTCAADKVKPIQSNWELKLVEIAVERLKALRARRSKRGVTPVALQAELQNLMWEKAGPFRTGEKLAAALARIQQMQRDELLNISVTDETSYNLDLQEWFELRAMLTTAEAVVRSALARNESRGAHQREDFPEADPGFLKNQVLELKGDDCVAHWEPPVHLKLGEQKNG